MPICKCWALNVGNSSVTYSWHWMYSYNYISKAVQTSLIFSLLKLYDFKFYAGAVPSVIPVLRKWDYFWTQKINNHPIAKVQLKVFHLV